LAGIASASGAKYKGSILQLRRRPVTRTLLSPVRVSESTIFCVLSHIETNPINLWQMVTLKISKKL